MDIVLAYRRKDQFLRWPKFPGTGVVERWAGVLKVEDPSGIKKKYVVEYPLTHFKISKSGRKQSSGNAGTICSQKYLDLGICFRSRRYRVRVIRKMIRIYNPLKSSPPLVTHETTDEEFPELSGKLL